MFFLFAGSFYYLWLSFEQCVTLPPMDLEDTIVIIIEVLKLKHVPEFLSKVVMYKYLIGLRIYFYFSKYDTKINIASCIFLFDA